LYPAGMQKLTSKHVYSSWWPDKFWFTENRKINMKHCLYVRW